MKQATRSSADFAVLFFLIIPFAFWEKVAAWTKKFSYKDWVVEKIGKDRDGQKKKVRYFEDVPPDLERRTTNKRHRADKEKKRYTITPGFVLCFIAHLLLQGAHFGDKKPSTKRLYRKGAYGTNIPVLRNVLTHNAFIFMRRYIHFCDNHKRIEKGN